LCFNAKTSTFCVAAIKISQDISLLREDVKNNTPGSPADRQCTAPLCVTSECVTSESEQNSENWKTVVCKENKIK